MKIKKANSNVDSPPREVITQPADVDVLCGKQGPAFGHVGNKRFRFIIMENLSRYLAAPNKTSRSKVVKAVYADFQKAGTRFLRRDTESGFWYAIHGPGAREKVSHSFRDRVRERTRAAKKREQKAKMASSTKHNAGWRNNAKTRVQKQRSIIEKDHSQLRVSLPDPHISLDAFAFDLDLDCHSIDSASEEIKQQPQHYTGASPPFTLVDSFGSILDREITKPGTPDIASGCQHMINSWLPNATMHDEIDVYNDIYLDELDAEFDAAVLAIGDVFVENNKASILQIVQQACTET